jgi:hypothetical protein
MSTINGLTRFSPRPQIEFELPNRTPNCQARQQQSLKHQLLLLRCCLRAVKRGPASISQCRPGHYSGRRSTSDERLQCTSRQRFSYRAARISIKLQLHHPHNSDIHPLKLRHSQRKAHSGQQHTQKPRSSPPALNHHRGFSAAQKHSLSENADRNPSLSTHHDERPLPWDPHHHPADRSSSRNPSKPSSHSSKPRNHITSPPTSTASPISSPRATPSASLSTCMVSTPATSSA